MMGSGSFAGLAGAESPHAARRRGLRIVVLTVLLAGAVAIAAASSDASAAPSPVASAASSAVCSKLGATGAVVTGIFGAGAKTSTYKATTTTYCDITPPGVSPDGCSTHECTDVFDFTTGLSADVAYQAAEFKEYGRGVSEVPVAGAGAGAVLLKAASYGSSSYGLGPVLFFAGGHGTIAIQGSLGGPPVFKKWEALARAIHAHLG
jgi:hypothetical protein